MSYIFNNSLLLLTMDLEDRIKALLKRNKPPSLEEINSGTYPPIPQLQAEFDKLSPEPYVGSRPKWDQYALGENMEDRLLTRLAKQFCEQNPGLKKDISIPDWINQRSSDGLLANALRNNDGISIGDIHPSKNLHAYIESKMQFFKEHGVKAVAMEIPSDLHPFFEELNKLPTKEARLAKWDEMFTPKGQKPDIPGDSATMKRFEKENPSFLQQDEEGFNHIIRSALANNMLIMAKDSTLHEEDKQVDAMGRGNNLRISEANFTWSHNINSFRRDHNFGPGDKMLDIGGEAHYDDSRGGHVDEITGFPSFSLRPKDGSMFHDYQMNNNGTTDYTIQIDDPGDELKGQLKSLHPKDIQNNPPGDKPLVPYSQEPSR